MTERAERCERCRFWNDDREPLGFSLIEVTYRQCRRHAPQFLLAQCPESLKMWTYDHGTDEYHAEDVAEAEAIGAFPMTYPDDWCGEFKAKEADVPDTIA